MSPSRHKGSAFEPAGPTIAVCYFGITRSLEHTIDSIRANVIAPAAALGEVRVFTHVFDQNRLDNPRSGELGAMRVEEHKLLDSDWLSVEQPDECLAARGFTELAHGGDFWHDGGKSLRNLVHQLHSLDVVTRAALAWQPDVVVYCRPDLRYLDSLEPWLKHSVATPAPTVWVPNWQHWGGFNDRFAICSSAAAAAYGSRIDFALDYVKTTRRPLHGERLLAWVLKREGIAVKTMTARAVRVRIGGREVRERFLPGWTDLPVEWFWQLVRWLRTALRRR